MFTKIIKRRLPRDLDGIVAVLLAAAVVVLIVALILVTLVQAVGL